MTKVATSASFSIELQRLSADDKSHHLQGKSSLHVEVIEECSGTVVECLT